MLSPLRYERLIVGYHGCDRRLGEEVLLRGTGLVPSNNAWDWLGAGVYFWEHGPARAMDWAVDRQGRGKIEEPFVLGAFIHLGRCLDLADTAAVDLVADWYEVLKNALKVAGHPLPENKPLHSKDADKILRHLDCAVLNYGLADAETEAPFQTVRGVFTEGGPAFAGSCIQARTHVQVAVRDLDCVLGYFKPSQPSGSQEKMRE